MKILKIKKGFTTNSSGGNEWIPPSDSDNKTENIKILKETKTDIVKKSLIPNIYSLIGVGLFVITVIVIEKRFSTIKKFFNKNKLLKKFTRKSKRKKAKKSKKQ